MNKIINGKRYDTDKAKEIGSWENMDDAGNFDYICETLYRKRTGELFLHCQGGPRTPYATFSADGWAGNGEVIRPVSYDAAKKWAEEHLTADEYEAVFGEVSEDAGNVPVTLSIPAAMKMRLESHAVKAGKSQSAVVAELIENAKTEPKVKRFSVDEMKALEEKRGCDVYDHETGECFEVIALRVYCEDVADIDRAQSSNVFKTRQEAVEFAMKKNEASLWERASMCDQDVYIVKARLVR